MAQITKQMQRGNDKVLANGKVMQSHGTSSGVPHITIEGLKVSFDTNDIRALELILNTLKAQAD